MLRIHIVQRETAQVWETLDEQEDGSWQDSGGETICDDVRGLLEYGIHDVMEGAQRWDDRRPGASTANLSPDSSYGPEGRP